MMEEHRHFPRFAPDERGPIEIQAPALDHRRWMVVRDISEGGVCLEAPLDLGDLDLLNRVPVILSLPGRMPFKATARVRYLRGREHGRLVFGMEFVRLPAAGLREIRNFLRNNPCGRISA